MKYGPILRSIRCAPQIAGSMKSHVVSAFSRNFPKPDKLGPTCGPSCVLYPPETFSSFTAASLQAFKSSVFSTVHAIMGKAILTPDA